MKALFFLVGAAVLLVSCQTAGAAPSRRRLVDGQGQRYTLAVPVKPVHGPVTIGPLYNSVPKNHLLYFRPNIEFLAGKTNVPTMIPVLRK